MGIATTEVQFTNPGVCVTSQQTYTHRQTQVYPQLLPGVLTTHWRAKRRRIII